MVWVQTFCGCISTRKGSVVIATLCLIVAIPSLIFSSLEVNNIVTTGMGKFPKAYVGVVMTTLVLAALYVLSSLALLSAAENNVRDLHLPWLVVHPLVETGLMLFLGYAAVVLARYDYHGYTIPVVFAMFIIFWILTYLWVVVMGNYQRLGTTDPEDAKQLLEGWHDAGQGYPRVQPQPEYPHGYSQVYSQGMRVPRSKTSWAAPPPPSGPPPPPPAPYNAFS